MMFKLGWREFERSIFMNLIVILLLSTVFAVTISLVSGIVSRYQYYKPYKDVLNRDGMVSSVGAGMLPYDYTAEGLTYEEAFNGIFQGVDEIIYNMRGDFSADESGLQNQSVFFYDKKNLDYKPLLSSGIWLNKAKFLDDTIPVVISQNNQYNVGDIFSLYYTYDYSQYVDDEEQTHSTGQQKFKVVGVLAKNATIQDNTVIGSTSNNLEKVGAKFLYSTYNSDFYDELYIFSTREFLKSSTYGKRNSLFYVSGDIFFINNKNITEEQEKNNRNILLNMNASLTFKNSEIQTASLKNIYSQLYNLLPIIIMSFMLTLISTICVSAISVKKQLRNFAVYYICGLKWKQCSIINLINSLIILVISIAFSSVSIAFINNFGLLKNTVIDLGFWQLLTCVIIGTVNCLIAFILPVIIVRNTPPREVLKEN
ncbi:hypothetical protein FACS1894132_02890 [Clostridia bacterium]|nr:hypothetical protein FACS1894132_02890 [Clostridia bacterium]